MRSLRSYVVDYALRLMWRRTPDIVIGGDDNPYLRRWYILPRNPFFNIYLHEFLRSDDDRALHDHPWLNVSWLLAGSYCEHTISAGGIGHVIRRKAGDIKARRAVSAHRIELDPGTAVITLFITGPRIRDWGFHCPKGWVHWQDFTAGPNGEVVGKGCGDD